MLSFFPIIHLSHDVKRLKAYKGEYIIIFFAFTSQIAFQLAINRQCGIAAKDADNVTNTPEGHLGFYPWAGALCLSGVAPSPRSCFCSSSLVSSRFVLTAGHCLVGHKATDIQVVFGSADYQNSNEAMSVSVRRVIIHPEYVFDEQGGPNDIALIELTFPLQTTSRIQPICLDSTVKLKDGELAVVAGWGWIKNVEPGQCALPMSMARPARTHLLHQGHVQIELESGKCQLGDPVHPFMPSKEICTKGWDANPQHGDSGGPLMVNRAGRWHQVGVASYGKCHEDTEKPERLPDIFTSTLFYCPWIRAQTGGEIQC